MRIYFSKLTLVSLAVVLSFFYSFAANAAKNSRVDCGTYSFILPENYTVNYLNEKSDSFMKELLLTLPSGKNAAPAVITCMREKKTAYFDFVLSRKHKIKVQGGELPPAELGIEATDNVIHNAIPFRYSIMEEKVTKSREVRGKYYYIPALEIGAMDDDYHVLFFVIDFRREGEFFDMEEYKSSVNKAASIVLQSIRRKNPQ
jgi:hypothetical protein